MFACTILKCCGSPYFNEDFACALAVIFETHQKNYSGDDAGTNCDSVLECSRCKKMQCCKSFSIEDVAPFCDQFQISP